MGLCLCWVCDFSLSVWNWFRINSNGLIYFNFYFYLMLLLFVFFGFWCLLFVVLWLGFVWWVCLELLVVYCVGYWFVVLGVCGLLICRFVG